MVSVKFNSDQYYTPCKRYNTPFTRSSWLDELARRAGYMLAGRASSMFARSCQRGITLLCTHL